jgi:hypothetical protein
MAIKESEDYIDLKSWFKVSGINNCYEVRFMLRSLSLALDEPKMMSGNNISVVLNSSVPSRFLKKKHNAIAYHCVYEKRLWLT